MNCSLAEFMNKEKIFDQRFKILWGGTGCIIYTFTKVAKCNEKYDKFFNVE